MRSSVCCALSSCGPPPPTHTLTHPQGKLDMLVHEEMSGGGSVDVEESLELLT